MHALCVCIRSAHYLSQVNTVRNGEAIRHQKTFADLFMMPCLCTHVRYVYVNIHADGPTRVLCFSETPDEYARGSGGGGGDALSVLSARLVRAQQRIQVGSRCHPTHQCCIV